jgi:hypothetical protein
VRVDLLRDCNELDKIMKLLKFNEAQLFIEK